MDENEDSTNNDEVDSKQYTVRDALNNAVDPETVEVMLNQVLK